MRYTNHVACTASPSSLRTTHPAPPSPPLLCLSFYHLIVQKNDIRTNHIKTASLRGPFIRRLFLSYRIQYRLKIVARHEDFTRTPLFGRAYYSTPLQLVHKRACLL